MHRAGTGRRRAPRRGLWCSSALKAFSPACVSQVAKAVRVKRYEYRNNPEMLSVSEDKHTVCRQQLRASGSRRFTAHEAFHLPDLLLIPALPVQKVNSAHDKLLLSALSSRTKVRRGHQSLAARSVQAVSCAQAAAQHPLSQPSPLFTS
jgi:hypothetical protein